MKSNEATKLPVEKDSTLFELVHLSHQIQQALVESFGEVTPDMEKSIAKLHEKLPDKADGYKFFIDDLKAQAEVWNDRAATLSSIAKAFMNYTEKLKYSLKMACVELGVDELKGNQYRWKLVNNAPSVIVDDEAKIPSNFKEIVQTTKLRKDLLSEALKSGAAVPGAHLEQGTHVRPYPNTSSKK